MNRMKTHNIEQGTPEWFEVRKGKMTASHARAIGNCSKGLETYVKEIVMKQLSSKEDDNYTNKDLERGNTLEPIARSIYELERDVDVLEVGFLERDKYSGCSPDGLVGEDGGIEIKAPDDKGYFEYILSGEKAIKSEYIWQVQMSLLITGRKWWDFIAYNPNFEKSIFIFRIVPDKDAFEKLEKGLKKGKESILVINKLIK